MPFRPSVARFALISLCSCCILPPASHSTEGAFSAAASGTADFAYVLDAGEGTDWGAASFSPALDFSWRNAMLRFSVLAEQGTLPAKAAFSIPELYVHVDIADRAQIRAGRFAPDTGPALFFHRSAFLGSSDPTDVFATGSVPRAGSEDAGELRVFGDGWTLSALAAPFMPGFNLPDTGNPWFPMADIPRTIRIPWYGYEAVIDTVRYDGNGWKAFELDPSYRLSLILNTAAADLGLVFFFGRERTVALLPMAVWPSKANDMDRYDLYLKPIRNQVAAAALSASGSADRLSYWLDSSATFGAAARSRYVMANYLADWPEAEQYDALGMTGGVGWTTEIGAAGIAASAECSWTWYTDQPRDFRPPSLDRAGIFMVRLYDGEERMSADTALAVDFRDLSTALVLSARYRFTDTTALSLSAPFFFGDLDDSLGQYATRRTLHLNFSYRY